MFSMFRGKGVTPDPAKDAPDSRGLEVKEDDPDTAWSLWDSALAEQDSRFLDLPPITRAVPLAPEPSARSLAKAAEAYPDLEIPTQPLSLEDASPAQRMKAALDVVELHHHRIANTIRTLWGYKECSVYINKLIMNGGDGMGNARIGFNQEAADAMMVLADLHDAEFGSAKGAGALGFADSSFQTGYNGHR
ncbi:MAG: hypothetical protein A3E00_00940 [Curvibacter sp. RIFCSPHIGHO2_12_FULL_63_18]|uniref:hypothetical protein n=1 Tax=Rhodoferax sp. TaxID=50421 RepID=UPI0008D2C9F0|nr:hypothetical protein [Rhodoferax sp.]OGO98916.1 MAG: hypothetical protein A2037_02065 [Curvibacter sp. GWA2_63_95]OGP06278.1 MAG: hypothetical protein A3E00_00940 [Curvibacter sp. RIFCSPHIGHO2_12_FULL_63_18]HCX83096.1 hypothetical protein [Rhodoferax sp.]